MLLLTVSGMQQCPEWFAALLAPAGCVCKTRSAALPAFESLKALYCHLICPCCIPAAFCACRTAEDLLLGSAGDLAGLSNHSADESNRQQQQGTSTAGGDGSANGQLTPSQGRYNLRSRTHSTPQQGNSGNGAAEDLVKPLLAEEQHAHEHDDEHAHAHQHSHDHAHDHGHGCTAGHSVSVQQQHAHVHLAHTHHHAVVVGDLRQGVVLLVAMAVHTFLECMALGLMVRMLLYLFFYLFFYLFVILFSYFM